MTEPRIPLEHGAVDGLSTVQRAILRFLLKKDTPTRCSELISSLLNDSGVPDGVTWESIDATMMAMSHPRLCAHPSLEYIGNARPWPDGWLPGSFYRMVGAGVVARGLMDEPANVADIWDPSPLPVRLPFSLLFGCATWEIETDQEYPEDKREQAPIRTRCTVIHCLGCDEFTILKARDALVAGQGIRECLTMVGDSCPIGCYSWPLQDSVSAFPAGEGISHISTLPGGYVRLPHGMLVRLIVAQNGTGNGVTAHILSIPSLVLVTNCDDDSSTFSMFLDQPACGRHIGDEVSVLEAIEGCSVRNAGGVVVDAREAFDLERLVHSTPIVPLPRRLYVEMLSGDRA